MKKDNIYYFIIYLINYNYDYKYIYLKND